MSEHIWVDPPVPHLNIRLPLQHLYHLLVSALMLSQLGIKQVNYVVPVSSYVFLKLIIIINGPKLMNVMSLLFLSNLLIGGSSTMSTVYTSQRSVDNTVEIGQGNLRLHYTADEGKLMRYFNIRNLVRCV